MTSSQILNISEDVGNFCGLVHSWLLVSDVKNYFSLSYFHELLLLDFHSPKSYDKMIE